MPFFSYSLMFAPESFSESNEGSALQKIDISTSNICLTWERSHCFSVVCDGNWKTVRSLFLFISIKPKVFHNTHNSHQGTWAAIRFFFLNRILWDKKDDPWYTHLKGNFGDCRQFSCIHMLSVVVGDAEGLLVMPLQSVSVLDSKIFS